MDSFNSKILLFGEYTILQNSMALVIPCDLYSGKLSFYEEAANKKDALQSNEYLKKFSGFIASHVDENFVLEVMRFERELEKGLFFQSTIPQGYGLGSSGALVVAIFLRYLKKAKSLKDDLKVLTFQKMDQLKNSLGKLESYFHGVSSGLDPLSIILNEPLLYKGIRNIVTTTLPLQDDNGKNIIFLLNTHISRHTSAPMKKFNRLQENKQFQKKLKEELARYNTDAIHHFLENDRGAFYQQLCNISSFQLNEMHEFIPETLQPAVKNGLDHGDYFLKLCGAGGGGFMLGFTRNWEKTRAELHPFDLQIIYRY